MVIFDCNGVLVDSEPLATAVASSEFMRAGFALTPDVIARYFTGRRAADMFNEVEIAAVFEWAQKERVAVVPYGGGTSVVGGLVCPLNDRYRGTGCVDMGRHEWVVEVDTD